MTIKLRKAIIRTGTFNRPDRKGTFEVTHSRLDHWAATFADMKKKGINVPVVVDHIVDVAHTVGRVSGVERVGIFSSRAWNFRRKNTPIGQS